MTIYFLWSVAYCLHRWDKNKQFGYCACLKSKVLVLLVNVGQEPNSNEVILLMMDVYGQALQVSWFKYIILSYSSHLCVWSGGFVDKTQSVKIYILWLLLPLANHFIPLSQQPRSSVKMLLYPPSERSELVNILWCFDFRLSPVYK